MGGCLRLWGWNSMYTILLTIEKGAKGLRIFFKLAYYRIKYGDRLKLGKKVHFRKGFIINISKNGKLEIGDGNFFNNYCSINCRDYIKIGNNNLFGEGVRIYDHNHVFNVKNVDIEKSYKTHPIVIGSRNWFGSNVVVLSKAKIGDNNVFGANSVLNSEFGSDNLVKQNSKLDTKRIEYK